ncbi:MAG: DUF4221 family protein [Bacteroidetes bacterium]|nr:DUF4221 family protein [Bacteroidota bacterium]
MKLEQVSDTMFFSDGKKRYPMWFEYKTNQLIFRNKADSVLEYFDINTHALTKTEKVDSKFWEFVASPSDELVVFSGNDLIFLYDTLYNMTGLLTVWDLEKEQVKKQFPVAFNEETDHIFARFTRYFTPYFDYENQRIFTEGFNYENYDERKYPLDTEVLTIYDMLTGQRGMVPFKYPEIFAHLDLCGLISEVYGCYRNDSIIITYSASPDIDVYDVGDSLLTRYVIPHPHYDSLAGASPDVRTNHDLCRLANLTEFFFGPVKYNPAQDLFYRTYRDKMELMKPDSTYNTEYDKPFGIQVLGPDLEVLGDFPIGSFYPWKELFEMYPTKTGLLYTDFHARTDSIFLHYLNFTYE